MPTRSLVPAFTTRITMRGPRGFRPRSGQCCAPTTKRQRPSPVTDWTARPCQRVNFRGTGGESVKDASAGQLSASRGFSRSEERGGRNLEEVGQLFNMFALQLPFPGEDLGDDRIRAKDACQIMLPKVPILEESSDESDPVYLGNFYVLGFPLLHHVAEKHQIIVLRGSPSRLRKELINSGDSFGQLLLLVNRPWSKRGHQSLVRSPISTTGLPSTHSCCIHRVSEPVSRIDAEADTRLAR